MTNFESKKNLLNKEYSRGLEIRLEKIINKNWLISLPFATGLTKGISDSTNRNFAFFDTRIQYEYPFHRFYPYISSGLSAQRLGLVWNLGVPIRGGINIRLDSFLFLNFEIGVRYALVGEKNIFQKNYAVGLNIRFLTKEKKTLNLVSPVPEIIENKDTLVVAQESIDSTFEVYLQFLKQRQHQKRIKILKKLENKNLFVSSDQPKDLPDSLCRDLLKRITVMQLLFGFNQYNFGESNNSVLTVYSNILNQDSCLKLRIHGFTDNVGNANYNIKLSALRAKSCADFIIENGGNRSQIEIISHGKENPKYDNSTTEARALNRRVDFELIYK